MRVATMLACGLVTAVIVGACGVWNYAALIGWDVAAVIFVGWVWLAVSRMDARNTARHATRENPDRAASDAILLVAAIASLVAVGFVLVRANSSTGTYAELLATLAVASVVLSWFAVHTVYMLRYAELYYAGTRGGVDFNQDEPPRYLDFAYLSFTIGMTFQVSDTNLQAPSIRATALRQALVSYLFGAVILASMINLIAGLGTGRG
jgi:uncharacterized membrane protein